MPRNRDAHESITARVIEALERGVPVWTKPWNVASGRPRSMSTSRQYTGINVWLLSLTALERGYESPWWSTVHQINKLGGHVRKGENQANGRGATTIMLWKSYVPRHAEPDPETGAVEERRVARLFQVFNAEQCEELPERYTEAMQAGPEALSEPQELLDAYLAHGGPALRHCPGDSACYDAGADQITLPPREQFKTAELYYSAAYHETGHSTGHSSRLDRPGIATFDHFGSERYAKEELCAQMTSAMCCAEAGIDTDGLIEWSAAYVADWLTALRNDHRLVVSAASEAEKAAELITSPARTRELGAA